KRTDERLAETQKRTDERFDSLSESIRELSEAQKRTDESLKELAEAQKRTDERLTETQKRTDERINSLSESIRELSEAQKRTDESLNRLTEKVDALATAVGSLSDTVGYGLEDIARKLVPAYLEKHHNIILKEPFQRKILEIDGEEFEIDLYANGVGGEGDEILLLGEIKSKFSMTKLRNFIRTAEIIQEKIKIRIVKFIFGYYIPLIVERVARENDVLVIYTY
ncbi:MAG: hypothetical protein ACTSWN_09605, partial [Promethearchaeota archaeon]